MDKIQKEISDYLSSLSSVYAPIKYECEQYIKYHSIIDGDFSSDEKGNNLSYLECICIAHNPILHKDCYTFTLNKGIDPAWINKFYERTNIRIPKIYSDFLLEMNGCNLFDMMLDGITLLGLPPKIYYEEGIKPYMVHDLEHPHIKDKDSDGWYFNYYNGFNIGSRSADYQDILIGYFIVDDRIIAASHGGKIENEYNNFTDFLSNEIKMAKEFFEKCQFKHEVQ